MKYNLKREYIKEIYQIILEKEKVNFFLKMAIYMMEILKMILFKEKESINIMINIHLVNLKENGKIIKKKKEL